MSKNQKIPSRDFFKLPNFIILQESSQRSLTNYHISNRRSLFFCFFGFEMPIFFIICVPVIMKNYENIFKNLTIKK